jgi:hypothetical protein
MGRLVRMTESLGIPCNKGLVYFYQGVIADLANSGVAFAALQKSIGSAGVARLLNNQDLGFQ